MSNSRSSTHRQTLITTYRVVTLVLLIVLVTLGSILLFRPAPVIPTAAEIAEAVNGPAEFQRPSAMEYVAKTDSCVVGGTLVSAQWHVGSDTYDVGEVEPDRVDYTTYSFKSDAGREFNVSSNGALWGSSGENYGLELYCDPATMHSDESFGLVAIIYGGM